MDTPNMPTESDAPIGSSGGGNTKFIIGVVAFVIIVGIVALAWVLGEDGDSETPVYTSPTLTPEEAEYSMMLPEEVRFHLKYEDINFFVVDFSLIENCSIRMDNYWVWEDNDDGFGYRQYKDMTFLVGPVIVYDMYSKLFDPEKIINPGTPIQENE